MNELILSATGSVILGLMTTLHPCPMATNIAAISYLSGMSGKGNKRTISQIFFSLGYLFSLLALALLIGLGLISIPHASIFLQSILSSFLGPLLILAGMVLTEMINLGGPVRRLLPRKEHWHNKPVLYTFLMGALLAVAFCPSTAFIYFGIMIPSSVKSGQILFFPMLYAIGALLPIMTVSILVNQGLVQVLREKWAKKIQGVAGLLLILIGIYITIEQLYL